MVPLLYRLQHFLNIFKSNLPNDSKILENKHKHIHE